MADNIDVTPGSGKTVAADDIAGVLFQRIKLGLGADGAATDAEGGAGAVGAGVLRTTLASDDPLVAQAAAGIPLGAQASGGVTPYNNIDVDESEDEVKGSAGQLYWIQATNLSKDLRFLKIYDALAASVTVGVTVPTLTIPLPPKESLDTTGSPAVRTGKGGVVSIVIPNGMEFATGITIAATTGVGDADASAPGVNEVVVNLGYA